MDQEIRKVSDSVVRKEKDLAVFQAIRKAERLMLILIENPVNPNSGSDNHRDNFGNEFSRLLV
jgi:hypothetical protein